MKTVRFQILTIVSIVVLTAVGCATPGEDAAVSQEIVYMQQMGQLRSEAEDSAATVPPQPAREASDLQPATSHGELAGTWRYVMDYRPERDQVEDWILHIGADRFFFQSFVNTDHGDLYAFAARGPLLEDEQGRIYFAVEEVRDFDPNRNMVGDWQAYPAEENPPLEFLKWPVLLRRDPNGSARVFMFQLRPDEVKNYGIRPYTPEPDSAAERFQEEDAGLPSDS